MVDLPNSITSGAEFTSVRRKQLKKFCLNLLQPLKLQELRENLSLMELLKSLGSEQLNSTELQCNCFGDRPGFPLPQAALSFLSRETVLFQSPILFTQGLPATTGNKAGAQQITLLYYTHWIH